MARLGKVIRMRLIDADEFISYLINRYGGNDTGEEIIEDLYNQPTVDSVERKKANGNGRMAVNAPNVDSITATSITNIVRCAVRR